MNIYLVVLLGILAWKYIPRPWHPTLTLETPHHIIYSTATQLQTEATARALELLYSAYTNEFAGVVRIQPNQPKLKLKLYKNRDELRRINPNMGWAEAFYREPYCNAYYSDTEINPYHWMLHESVHQLNNEVAHFHLEKWLNEGLAEYFSTSRLAPHALLVNKVDINTYPVWWLDDLATEPSLEANIQNGSVIPLREIITGSGGPAMNSHFNLYYLHWWTLTRFLFQSPAYRQHAIELAQRGGRFEDFEKLIGPVDKIQIEWHEYVRQLKKFLENPAPKHQHATNHADRP